MKQELKPEQEIEEVINDLHNAMLADLKAKRKEIEVAREKTKTHNDLVLARQRLYSLDLKYD